MKRVLIAGALVFLAAAPVMTQSPYGYPWRGQVPLTLIIRDHTSPGWRSLIEQAAADWSLSPVLDVVMTPSDGVCDVKAKRDICDGYYGTGSHDAWTVYDSRNGYMTDAYTQLNDSYLDNYDALGRAHAVCHEMGNMLGLLTDRACTYYAPGGGSNWEMHPTQADYDQLLDIYGS